MVWKLQFVCLCVGFKAEMGLLHRVGIKRRWLFDEFAQIWPNSHWADNFCYFQGEKHYIHSFPEVILCFWQ